MTAEACVMNKLGIALAADSAVSWTHSHKPKIYQSADKLFLLSEADPVAVMVYGSASFVGVPWETTIKRYRALHGKRSFPTVSEHADAFLSFLEKDRRLFPRSAQGRQLLFDLLRVFAGIREKIVNTFKSDTEDAGSISERDVARIVRTAISERRSELRKVKDTPGLPKSHALTVRRLYAKEIQQAITTVFENLPMTPGTRKLLEQIAGCVATKGRWTDYSGVVVAGFGNDEVFPAVTSISVERLVAGRLKTNDRKEHCVSDERSTFVLGFAQTEMVHAYMEGIDPGVLKHVGKTVSNMFAGLPSTISGAIPDLTTTRRKALERRLSESFQATFDDLWREWKIYRSRHHSDPITEVIGVLPKAELASLAESLVNLTILRRRTSTDAETVAGPIDVAVITKGDGFVWIRRKHYFPAELNPRYLSKLHSGGGS